MIVLFTDGIAMPPTAPALPVFDIDAVSMPSR